MWDNKLKTLYAAIVFTTFVLMIRYASSHLIGHDDPDLLRSSAVYRTIELADGWNGKVISTQKWFSTYQPQHAPAQFEADASSPQTSSTERWSCSQYTPS